MIKLASISRGNTTELSNGIYSHLKSIRDDLMHQVSPQCSLPEIEALYYL